MIYLSQNGAPRYLQKSHFNYGGQGNKDQC